MKVTAKELRISESTRQMTFSVNNTAEHTPLSVFYKGAKPTQQRLGYLYRYIYLNLASFKSSAYLHVENRQIR